MSWVSEIKDICGDYMIDVKYHEEQKEAITLFFNSRRNAETVKRCIELDDSVPNVATAVDFVEVIRCRECKFWGGLIKDDTERSNYCCRDNMWCMPLRFGNDYCSYGERREE